MNPVTSKTFLTIAATVPAGRTSLSTSHPSRKARNSPSSDCMTSSTARCSASEKTAEAPCSESVSNDGSMPNSSAFSRKIREAMPWMVDTHALSMRSAQRRYASPRSPPQADSSRNAWRTRDFNSAAAFLVKVMAST